MIIFYILLGVKAQQIIDLRDDTIHLNVHQDEKNTVLEIPLAWDGIMNGNNCEVIQKQIISNTQLISLINFNETYPEILNLMSQDDNQVAILTSNSKLIIINKKNYNNIEQYQLTDMENAHQILISNNIILIITQNETFVTYIQPFNIITVKSWIPRNERWLTSIFDDYIYSAVGNDGIDIYYLHNLTYYRNINAIDLKVKQLCVRDFTIYNNTLYILDCNRGVLIAQMKIYSNVIDFSVRTIDIQEGGIAIDTKNGINVFVGYKWRLRYAVVEYIIDEYNWRIQNLVYTNRIKDIDANNDYALVQESTRHMVAFNYGSKLSNNVLQFQVRDFELRNNLVVGITLTNVLFNQLQVVPLRVDCMFSKTEQEEFYLTYNISHNSSIIERHHLRFTVEVIDTYVYSDHSYLIILIIVIIAILIILLIALIFRWYTRLSNEERIIQRTVNKYSITIPTSGRTNTQQSARPFSPTNAQFIINQQ